MSDEHVPPITSEKVVRLRPARLLLTREQLLCSAIESNVLELENAQSTVRTIITALNSDTPMEDEDCKRVLWVVHNLLGAAIHSLERARTENAEAQS